MRRTPKQPKDTFTPFIMVFFLAIMAKLLYCVFVLFKMGAFDNLF
ncbi:hypothetical protein [Runella rosea]|nr:hypothetical protein [Runella rosea]